MHGRLKVRTSAEENERKKKEQALKVKAYKAAMARIQAKRQRQEYDDEMLQLTTHILLRNPDVTTLWNVRRECLLQKVKTLERTEQRATEEGAADDAGATGEQQVQAIYETELALTEQCLSVNPKSYNIWHHRSWLLEHAPHADWQREVQLCTKYLKMDERNFHTWDYRRYVVEKAGVPRQQELDFCTEKIKVNFSNYSSWHHRSLLLPALYPYEGEARPRRPMAESKLKEELEMVLTAAFTDPNDSSAWFYQRWLLGYSRPELAVCAFRCNNEKAVLSFTKPIPKDSVRVELIDGAGQKLLAISEWLCVNGGPTDATLYAEIANLANPMAAEQLEIAVPALPPQKLPLKTYDQSVYYFRPPQANATYTDDVLAELRSQLDSCSSLLEFEPDSKWTLLTSALLMRAIDGHEYHGRSLEYLGRLQQVDALRAGYYRDLASKWILEKLLIDWSNSAEVPARIDLSQHAQLCVIADVQYLSIADTVVLSAELQQHYPKMKSFPNIGAPV